MAKGAAQVVRDPERRRLEAMRNGTEDWRRWGPYVSERQWGTVREDYSAGGTAWDYFTHDQARSRAYRWGEDGIAGFCDDRQLLCLSLALWNGHGSDPEGTPVRPDQPTGQSRRGRQGALLLPRRGAEPRLPEDALQVDPGSLSVSVADRRERASQRREEARIRTDRHRAVRSGSLLRRRSGICQGSAKRHPDACHRTQSRPRHGADPHSAAGLVSQYVELERRDRPARS